jgi:hypothetical protein
MATLNDARDAVAVAIQMVTFERNNTAIKTQLVPLNEALAKLKAIQEQIVHLEEAPGAAHTAAAKAADGLRAIMEDARLDTPELKRQLLPLLEKLGALENRRQTATVTPTETTDEEQRVPPAPFPPPNPSTGPAPTDTRISLRLSQEARTAVEKIMQLGNMDTMQEAIRRAIGEELFLMTERRAGWKVLLQKGDRYREVIFPQL